MKIKTNELTGPALDWAVAKADGQALTPWVGYPLDDVYSPSTDWAQGGPIIEREGIDLFCSMPTNPDHPCGMSWTGSWQAQYHRCGYGTPRSYGKTPLIAAMRCYAASRLGDEVDVPEELK